VSIKLFKPEIWSANLLVAARNALVYGGPDVVNHDYEGDISEYGDTVRITSISRPTIGTYVPNSTVITPEQITDAQRTLTIDQAKYFAFEVDDVDARQARANVIPQAMSEAAYAMANVIDQYIASFYTQIQSANALGSITVNSSTTPTDAYDKVLVPMKIKLDRANVPTNGRYTVITPEMHGCLLRDGRFIKVSESGTDEALRNGMVGRAAGFNIMLSNNAPNTTGSEYAVPAGVQSAISLAMQIAKTEAYRPQSSFADAVKGLNLYGAKVLRPDFLASALVTVS
jgi:N4-gp56 family major capsid protein